MSAEFTTAATDGVLAALAVVGALTARAPLWRHVFTLLAVASLLGALVHGWPMSERAAWWIWLPLNVALGASMALLVAASGWRHALPLLLVAGAVVAAIAQAVPESFLPIVVAEAVALLWSGATWLRRAEFRLAAGCALSLLAGAVQASGWRLRLGWEFDHNGLFHLAQIPAMLCWIAGARRPAPQ